MSIWGTLGLYIPIFSHMKSIIWGTPDCDLSHSYIALGCTVWICMIWKTLNDYLVICYHTYVQTKGPAPDCETETSWDIWHQNTLKKHLEKTWKDYHIYHWHSCKYHLIPSHTNLFSSCFMRLQAASVCNCHFLIMASLMPVASSRPGVLDTDGRVEPKWKKRSVKSTSANLSLSHYFFAWHYAFLYIIIYIY